MRGEAGYELVHKGQMARDDPRSIKHMYTWKASSGSPDAYIEEMKGDVPENNSPQKNTTRQKFLARFHMTFMRSSQGPGTSAHGLNTNLLENDDARVTKETTV